MNISLETILTPVGIGIIVAAIILCIIIFVVIFKKPSKSASDAEMKADIFKKATENWNSENEIPTLQADEGTQKKVVSSLEQTKKDNIRDVLLELASRGEAGVLPKSITDKIGISSQDTTSALTYLTVNNYAEAVNSTNGNKYYLTEKGRKFCVSKEFFSDFY